VDGVKYATVQAAITGAGATGEVYIPAGIHAPTSQIVAAYPIRICGAGIGATTIKPTAALASALFSITATGSGFELCNLTVDLTNAPAQSVLSTSAALERMTLRNVVVSYPNSAPSTGIAFDISGSVLNPKWVNVRILNPGIGVRIQGDTSLEDYFEDFMCDSPLTACIQVNRTTTTDTGAIYLHRVKLTDGNARGGKGLQLVSTAGTPTGTPVFANELICEAMTGDDVVITNINSFLSFENSWFVNAGGASKAALRLENASGLHFSNTYFFAQASSYNVAMKGTLNNITFTGSFFEGASATAFFMDTNPTLTNIVIDP